MKKVLVALMVVASLAAFGLDSIPLQIGLWAPKVQLVPEDINVTGLKVNAVYGRNCNITGLDLGIASSGDNVSALQINLLLNQANEQFSGAQLSLINHAENADGLSIGAYNMTADRTRGVQIGLVNSTMEMRGLQIGLINYCELMTGVQIGIINVIRDSPVPFCPIVNFCF